MRCAAALSSTGERGEESLAPSSVTAVLTERPLGQTGWDTKRSAPRSPSLNYTYLNGRDSLCIALFVPVVLFKQPVVGALSGQCVLSIVFPSQAVLHEYLDLSFVILYLAAVNPSGVSLQS